MTEPENLAELKTEAIRTGDEPPRPSAPVDEPTMQMSAAELLADDED